MGMGREGTATESRNEAAIRENVNPFLAAQACLSKHHHLHPADIEHLQIYHRLRPILHCIQFSFDKPSSTSTENRSQSFTTAAMATDLW